MSTTNIWNLYNISSKKIVSLVVIILFAQLSFGQSNIQKHDQKRENNGYSYGIHLGFTQHNFRVEHSDSFLNQDAILGVEGNDQTGISIGIIGALHPSEKVEIRAIPALNFGEQSLAFTIDGLEQQALFSGSATVFELPVQFKYKSEPYKDFRMFAIGGGMYRNNVSASKNVDEDLQTILLETSDVGIEIGGGAEFHFPYFVLAPQLTITQGFSNQNRAQNTAFSNAIGSLNSRIYSLSINIE